jgi:hypothetical protein
MSRLAPSRRLSHGTFLRVPRDKTENASSGTNGTRGTGGTKWMEWCGMKQPRLTLLGNRVSMASPRLAAAHGARPAPGMGWGLMRWGQDAFLPQGQPRPEFEPLSL